MYHTLDQLQARSATAAFWGSDWAILSAALHARMGRLRSGDMPLRVERKNKRAAVFLCVVLTHGILGALLIRTSPLHLPAGQVTQSFTIELLPELSRVPATRSRPETVVSKPRTNSDLKRRSTEPAESTGAVSNEHLSANAPTHTPPHMALQAGEGAAAQ